MQLRFCQAAIFAISASLEAPLARNFHGCTKDIAMANMCSPAGKRKSLLPPATPAAASGGGGALDIIDVPACTQGVIQYARG